MNDFFLIERAAQIQRLRAAKTGNRIEIPSRVARVGYSRCARRLYQTMDQISAIQLGEKRSWWLARLAERGVAKLGLRRAPATADDSSMNLTPPQREAVLAFERQVVQLQLEDRSDSTEHDTVLAAILRDLPTFSGLKPLQFHAASFPHELLFPSWLNLFTALVLPAPQSAEARFNKQQIRTVFGFLQDLEAGSDTSRDHAQDLLGVFTLVANRQPPVEAGALIQQLMNLNGTGDAGITTHALVQRWQETHESAAGLLELLKYWSIFATAARGGQVEAMYNLGANIPRYQQLPELTARQVCALGKDEAGGARWQQLVSQIARCYESGGGIATEYAEFLEQRTGELSTWLAFLLPDKDAPLSAESQCLLARLVRSVEKDPGGIDPELVRAFARILAPRLSILDSHAAALFEKKFIATRSNRDMLLQNTNDQVRRQQLAQQLLAQATKAGNWNRLLGQMSIAAAVGPDYDPGKLRAVGRTIAVLKALEANRFISANQLDELATDIRRRLPDSLEFLAAPHKGAATGHGRLAKLYLALYEECAKFEHYGETGNFGLTTAAYSNLNRIIDREL